MPPIPEIGSEHVGVLGLGFREDHSAGTGMEAEPSTASTAPSSQCSSAGVQGRMEGGFFLMAWAASCQLLGH